MQDDPHQSPHEGAPQSADACLERIDPAEADPHLATQHLARYAWAASLMPAPRVLDCGCGLGYGSAMLADAGAGEVLGIDIAADAVEEAARLYPRPGVTHRCVDAMTLEEAMTLNGASVGRFDVIVCLEVIEHVAEPQKLLDVLKSLLSPGGVLAVSCPDDEAIGVDNPFHIWEA
ncbi:MAG: methyltransferase domain-containing protein, partial [Phycisphaerales bacterium]